MQAFQFFKTITADRTNAIERLRQILTDNNIRYCVVGGVAASAYVEPFVSLDFDIVIASYQLGRFESLLASTFTVNRHPRHIEITLAGSDVRINVQTETCFAEFVDRAAQRQVLGMTWSVAAIEDVLSATIWAAQDPTRAATKRQRDLVDLARLLDRYPKFKPQVPPALLQRLITRGG